jgi:hypothetical protein
MATFFLCSALPHAKRPTTLDSGATMAKARIQPRKGLLVVFTTHSGLYAHLFFVLGVQISQAQKLLVNLFVINLVSFLTGIS